MMNNQTNNSSSKLLIIGAALVGLAFLASGSAKLAGTEKLALQFAEFGFPLWFMYLIGATEVVAGGLLFWSPTRFLASGVLAGVMVGAVGSHLMVGHGADTVPSAVLLVLTLTIAYATRDQLSVLIARVRGREAHG